jgi:hypothetical protein
LSKLYVNEIHPKSGDNILKPKQCAFRVFKSSDDASADLTSATLVTFDAVDFDINGDYDLANNKFVAPVDGIYMFTMSVRLRYVESATAVYLRFYKNGSSYWGADQGYHYIALNDPQGGNFAHPSGTKIVKLEAGDEMQVYVDLDGDTSVTVQYATTEFAGTLLS